MRTLLLLVLLFWGSSLYAQSFTPPMFPASGKSLSAFVPPNWFVKDSAQGDLNGDKIPDVALVVELKDTIQELRPDSSTNLGSPRILLILFKDQTTGTYQVVQQHNTFLLRYGEGGMAPEPYGKISIKNRVLEVSFEFVRSTASYKFRYQQNAFMLIGATNSGVSGGQFEKWDINFSTRKALHEWGDASGDKTQSEWKTVPVTKLRSLKEMQMPFQWEVWPNVYI
ncbi:hypothetical protein EFA69_17235 [Rufibacter immobilis]|uniref:VCBS repeat-containing protein n=1 Tax=Rufibacter immobilis TaxID=1348778 RepID=A0A3M9MQM9_9BACT|nr:hypothetical protein [Rufibacter immobilis]RNI27842.1 hypothetical protein EFA69_17235 [Rufibacter immobilis]